MANARKSVRNVLVCPINWGLGHATRDVPVIRELLKRGCTVTLASDGAALAFLKNEFPQLRFLELPGYRAEYSINGAMIFLKLALQTPKFARTIREEHKAIAQLAATEHFDLIVSDNRFGCWAPGVHCVMITHQLKILAPPLLSYLINRRNKNLIRHFSEIWVPDVEESRLAGDMTAPNGFKVRYIGHLSRFEARPQVPVKYQVLALVSGPEPQRQMLEDLLRQQLTYGKYRALLVCGRPDINVRREGLLTEVSHLSTPELADAVAASEVVISRSGYSTIMDLMVLGGKVIFIPTPGQPEQEFLAQELRKKKIAYSEDQEIFNMARALAELPGYTGFGVHRANNLLDDTLNSLAL